MGLFILLIVPLPNPSDALSCGLPPFTESFSQHDLLLHGVLVEKNIDRTSVLGNTDYNRLSTLVFDTISVYKGDHQDQFTIKADLSWDDYYIEGVDYVLFADKKDDYYIRDLCVPDYIAFPQIIQFLDSYPINLATGMGVYSLYDLVTDDDKIRLWNLMDLYNNINRGNTAVLMMKSTGNIHQYSCDFETDLMQAQKFLMDNYVVSQITKETDDYSISTESTLDTNPQTSVITFEGDKLRAEISVLNGKEFGNCFYIYNSKLINKITGEVEINRDGLSRMCYAQDAHELIPYLCPDKISSSIPSTTDHGGGFVDPECHKGHELVDGICKLSFVGSSEPSHTPEKSDEEICSSGTKLVDGVCTVIDNGCEPDMYGNIYCDPLVEDRLTLERFLFEPPIVNGKLTLPIGILILIISIIVVGIFVIIKKRK